MFIAFLACTNASCGLGFVANYKSRGNNQFSLEKIAVPKGKTRQFRQGIIGISPMFAEIYNEAQQAEQLSLLQICGAGYRKSLEFLIKDYLTTILPDKEQEIKDSPLGRCISLFVDNPNVKLAASRAVWLGNDETHYVRKWGDKDLGDLKKLIDMALHWIEMDLLTKEYETQMPGKG
jgi:hypothetical protein